MKAWIHQSWLERHDTLVHLDLTPWQTLLDEHHDSLQLPPKVAGLTKFEVTQVWRVGRHGGDSGKRDICLFDAEVNEARAGGEEGAELGTSLGFVNANGHAAEIEVGERTERAQGSQIAQCVTRT